MKKIAIIFVILVPIALVAAGIVKFSNNAAATADTETSIATESADETAESIIKSEISNIIEVDKLIIRDDAAFAYDTENKENGVRMKEVEDSDLAFHEDYQTAKTENYLIDDISRYLDICFDTEELPSRIVVYNQYYLRENNTSPYGENREKIIIDQVEKHNKVDLGQNLDVCFSSTYGAERPLRFIFVYLEYEDVTKQVMLVSRQ